jgi:DNA-binding FadR family transcriptional regulator
VKAGPGGGAVVSRPDPASLASTLALLLQFDGAPLRAVLEARNVLEPGMASLAARVATDAEIAAMGAALDDAAANVADYRRFVIGYRLYWELLAKATHNAVIAFLSPALRSIVDSGGFIPDEVQRRRLVTMLGTLHEAVAAREEEPARLRLAEIEQAFLDRLLAGYPQRVEAPVAWSDLPTRD